MSIPHVLTTQRYNNLHILTDFPLNRISLFFFFFTVDLDSPCSWKKKYMAPKKPLIVHAKSYLKGSSLVGYSTRSSITVTEPLLCLLLKKIHRTHPPLICMSKEVSWDICIIAIQEEFSYTQSLTRNLTAVRHWFNQIHFISDYHNCSSVPLNPFQYFLVSSVCIYRM